MTPTILSLLIGALIVVLTVALLITESPRTQRCPVCHTVHKEQRT